MAPNLEANRIANSHLQASRVNSTDAHDFFPAAKVSHEENRQCYLQTYFKAQINAVLKANTASIIRKKVPDDWLFFDKKLRSSGASVQKISMLRQSFDRGWKTWDGSGVFPPQKSVDIIPADLSSYVPSHVSDMTAATSLERGHGRSVQQKSFRRNGPKPPMDKKKPKGRPKKKMEEVWDSEERELIPDRTVSTSRHL